MAQRTLLPLFEVFVAVASLSVCAHRTTCIRLDAVELVSYRFAYYQRLAATADRLRVDTF